jgi:hypothetical protein
MASRTGAATVVNEEFVAVSQDVPILAVALVGDLVAVLSSQPGKG